MGNLHVCAWKGFNLLGMGRASLTSKWSIWKSNQRSEKQTDFAIFYFSFLVENLNNDMTWYISKHLNGSFKGTPVWVVSNCSSWPYAFYLFLLLDPNGDIRPLRPRDSRLFLLQKFLYIIQGFQQPFACLIRHCTLGHLEYKLPLLSCLALSWERWWKKNTFWSVYFFAETAQKARVTKREVHQVKVCY